jgi:HAD superfamily hydrolase (TIGR01509 family)
METGLVIFDCDGVLIDSEVISMTMLIGELRGHGLELTVDFVSRHFLGRSYPTVLREVRDRFGLDLPPGFEAAYRARLMAAFRRDLKVMPGVVDMVRQLALPFCVATSSSPERVRQSLEIAGLGELMGAHVFTASQVTRGKPAPDLFLLAAAEMGVEPSRCLVIEDTETGIRAGLAAGMQVWRFTGGSHLAGRLLPEPEDARPHRSFAAFSDFFRLAPSLRQHCGMTP